MKGIITSLVVTGSLLFGAGYVSKQILLTIERIVLTRIKKGLSSTEKLAQQLTGMKLTPSGKLVPINKPKKKAKAMKQRKSKGALNSSYRGINEKK